MIAWRIAKRPYSSPEAVLSGEGAWRLGGRWNARGLPLVYAATNSSLALLETLVNVSAHNLAESLVIVPIDVPDDAPSGSIDASRLPELWQERDRSACSKIGSKWIVDKSELVLRVPSATNPLDQNILINPLHEQISRCTVGAPLPVRFDPRLLQLVP
ncbi:MAG: RES family NAD+ phosphorylase [Candidatus Eremiobacteraeota bacterium]|nr:RES family NAD+ phosphorylase [Candidatus Eremiobacteraeota bacterium]